jgi:cell division protein FtsL
MASWGATAHVDAPISAPRPRPRVAAKAKPRAKRHHRPVNPLRSGITWIVIVGALLAGLVALNVAVLQLNVRIDKLGRERIDLRAQIDELSSQPSSDTATPRIQALARKRLGLVPVTPDSTTYVDLGGR